MRIIFMSNGSLGLAALRDLLNNGAEVVGLVVHPECIQRKADEMIEATGLPKDVVFRGGTLRDSQTLERLHYLEPDLGISVLFGYLLKKPFIDLFPHGIINLHLSYLPYGKGAYPNVWALVDKTPAGVTMHYIEETMDTGDIIAQCSIEVDATDTGESLYKKLQTAGLELFAETWPRVVSGHAHRTSQVAGEGTFHKEAELAQLDEIDLDVSYKAGDLLNILRARTFPPFKGAYFKNNGEKIYVRVNLLREGELNPKA